MTNRDATVERLCAHFARDAISATELERRLDIAYAARTPGELVSLERDLPPLQRETRPVAPAPRSSASVDPSRPARKIDLIVSVWGTTERKGSWVPPRTLTAVSVMGGTDLDFRQAAFATAEVSVRLFALMGGVDIVVPPGVRVEWGGLALMGGVTMPEPSTSPARDAPVIRISGLVCMGGVDVMERLPGESAGDARKRLRMARKAHRRRLP